MAFPASPADGQTTLVNGVTYIYSLANVSWSPYASNSTVAYTSIAVSGNANITGTTTSGTEIVTGNESVGGNSNVTGTLTAGSIVSASIIKRVGSAGAIDLNASTYFIGSQVVGFDVATNKPGGSYGVMLNIQERNDTAGQLVIDYNNGNLYTRGIYVPSSVTSGNTPTYSSWNTVLHSNNYTSYVLDKNGNLNNGDNYMNFRVMRNSNTTSLNDGMFIGYGNSNSGLTRIYGGGSTGNCAMMGSADFSPSATNTIDLGSASYRWRNIYTNDLHLSNGIGDYTVVEGEEDLFLVNNKSGKTFKFALIEVDPSVVPPKASVGK